MRKRDKKQGKLHGKKHQSVTAAWALTTTKHKHSLEYAQNFSLHANSKRSQTPPPDRKQPERR